MNLKLSKKIKLGKKIISENSEPYLIAEVSCNHNGRFMNAKKLFAETKADLESRNLVKKYSELAISQINDLEMDSSKKFELEALSKLLLKRKF